MEKFIMERVQRMQDLLLVIGLGGTGADVVSSIQRTFAKHFVEDTQTEYLVIDSDLDCLRDFDPADSCPLRLPGADAMLFQDIFLNEYEREWIDPALDFTVVGLPCRQRERLRLSRCFDTVYAAIHHKLSKLISPLTGGIGMLRPITVAIACSLCGGTGSGIFLDVAQIVRFCLMNVLAVPACNIKITGYFAMPDVLCQRIPAPVIQRVLKANGYAALKELDFWMNVGEHHTHYQIRYNDRTVIRWEKPPFDGCYLFNGSYESMLQTIAQSLLHRLADDGMEDGRASFATHNHQELLDRAGGYCTMGAYTLRIPKKEVLYFEAEMLLAYVVRQHASPADLNPADCAAEIAGDWREIGKAIASRIQLPDLLTWPFQQLQGMNPPPHIAVNRDEARFEGEAEKYAHDYLTAAWDGFLRFTHRVICDPALGLFRLKTELEKPDGLIDQLKALQHGWEAARDHFSKSRCEKMDAAASAYSLFVRPPLLFRSRAIEAYTKALNDYAQSLRNGAVIRMLVSFLEKLIYCIEKYRYEVLDPICHECMEAHHRFSHPETNNDQLFGSLFDQESVETEIVDTIDLLCEQQFSYRLSQQLRDLTPDPRFSPSHEAIREALSTALCDTLDEYLGGLHHRLFRMENHLANSEDAQRITDDLLHKAGVDRNHAANTHCFLCVPKEVAPLFNDVDRNRPCTLIVKPSDISDEIFCQTAIAGLKPSDAVALSGLAQAYRAALEDPRLSQGIHLVYHPDRREPFRNWAYLPDPS